ARKGRGEGLAGRGRGEAVHVEPVVRGSPAGPGPVPPRGPHPAGDRLEPQPALILRPHLDLLARAALPQALQPRPQIFFQRRRTAASAAQGWDGRGTWSVTPRILSHCQPVGGPTRTPHRPRTSRHLRAGPQPAIGRTLPEDPAQGGALPRGQTRRGPVPAAAVG